MDHLEIVKEGIENTSQLIDHQIDGMDAYERCGRVVGINGSVIEVAGLMLPIGYGCRLHLSNGKTADAEVIGFSNECISIMPFNEITGVAKLMMVSPKHRGNKVKVGSALLGRVINALGEPLDEKGEILCDAMCSSQPAAINPLQRKRITKTIDVGVRAMNGLLTVGEGQRMGIFAEAGLGKSVLLGMMTKYSTADIIIVGLIGERGREVKEFIEEILGEAGLDKTVVVASPADQSPLMKVTAANYATTIAEYFRDQGKSVLLILDSITRYAQAYRQMFLSDGEMPTSKGYTPSVFAKLSHLIERSGNGSGTQGSITAFYTVLTEGAELSDPIAEHVRSLIDGHVLLSRDLAEEGHFPAIDIERSVSRLMMNLVDEKKLKLAMQFKRLISSYNKNKDMINIGMYHAGADPYVDAAITYREAIKRYLTQGMNERASMDESLILLEQMIRQIGLTHE